MKKKLFTRIIIIYLIIISASFVIIGSALTIWINRGYKEEKEAQILKGTGVLTAYAIKTLYDNFPAERMNKALSDAGDYYGTVFLFTDDYGYVLNIPDNKLDKYEKLVGNQVITGDLEKLRNGQIIKNSTSYSNVFPGYTYTMIVPVIYHHTIRGTIMVNIPRQGINTTLLGAYMIIWVSVILAIVVSAYIISISTKKLISDPINKIINVADKISQGETDSRVSIETKDEIGRLGESFNSMANSLAEVEKNRRDFISNVSHELRSPITSIKGFIGGILDGVIPKEKEQYYLSITYDEIQRLTRLINDLLDLSAIEAGKFSLKIIEFDINSIIKACVLKFETKIKSKNLNVDVCFNQDKLYVIGDKDRINQVLTNLLDNSIKYANDNGIIKVYTRTRGEKAYISVFNDGPCISHEEMQHIWERFYKSDKSRTSKNSTGLGLPIVRSILTQLGQDIWVENKGNEGVTFTFTLKKVL